MLGRLSDSVAVYRLSEGLSESAAPTPLPRFVWRFVKGWSGWECIWLRCVRAGTPIHSVSIRTDSRAQACVGEIVGRVTGVHIWHMIRNCVIVIREYMSSWVWHMCASEHVDTRCVLVWMGQYVHASIWVYEHVYIQTCVQVNTWTYGYNVHVSIWA